MLNFFSPVIAQRVIAQHHMGSQERIKSEETQPAAGSTRIKSEETQPASEETQPESQRGSSDSSDLTGSLPN